MPTEKRDESFRMVIDECFAIRGRGICIAGRIDSGTLRRHDPIQISGMGKSVVSTTVAGFEGFIHDQDNWVAKAGDNCGILLKGLKLDQLEKGMLITKTGSNSGK